MPLFQKSVVKKYINDLNTEQLQTAWLKFQNHFHNTAIQHNIINAKEEEYQEGFVRDLFVNILGYTLKPQPEFNLVMEQKSTTDATKSDGAILSIQGSVVAVIELKDTSTANLDKVEKQAFGYKHQHKDCRYVITANFEQLRFYINDATEYEAFNLFTLDKESFALLYCCLHQAALNNDVPLKMKQQSSVVEENITKKLYEDYSRFKKQLFANITAQNPEFTPLELFKKTQKLLDRFLFIFFAEDRLLLPPNSIKEILNQWNLLNEMDQYVPLYDRFKKYFGYMNTGYVGKQYEIFAYNGGLFAPDEILDKVVIDDQLLYDSCKGLSNYDFESEVDVNILGHIFEHSLGEIEAAERKFNDSTDAEVAPQVKQASKRKKDGVFYTPKYITKYIVQNTLGALCSEKKVELSVVDDDFAPQKRKSNTRQLLIKLESYRQWLLQITICDPACGSGAFLNQALEFLIAEHQSIDILTSKLFGAPMVLSDIESAILENNLYGVDINNEAIEIAKLSLWLRTARKGRKLNSLSDHIKCGNSLIDDPEVAGDKAFRWQMEFPEVFVKGGFDVVIGNPPYVPAEMIVEKDKRFFEKSYSSAVGRLNLYPLFYEKSITLSHLNAKIGLITPYTILKNQYYKHCRKFILDNSYLESIIDFKGMLVFADAAVDSIIIILCKSERKNHAIEIIDSITNFSTGEYSRRVVSQKVFEGNDDFSFDLLEQKIDLSKIKKNCYPLGKIIDFNQGIITGNNKKFITRISNSITKKVITGSDFNRYSLNWMGDLIIYDEDSLHRPRKKIVFEAHEKLLIRQTGSYPICGFDTSQYYTLDTVHNGLLIDSEFEIKFIMALINSRLIRYLYEQSVNEQGKVFAQVKIIYIDPLPIKKVDKYQQLPFVTKVDTMISNNLQLQQIKNQLLQLLQSKFENLTLNKKLQDWPAITFKDFLKELEKQKTKLSLTHQAEWLQYFEAEKTKANNIQQLITETDKKINEMVYTLYDLSEAEKSLIEAG